MGVRLLSAAALLAASSWACAQSAQWIDVPFVPQPKDGCGAASLAMVMQYWAAHQGPAASDAAQVKIIQDALYSRHEHGIPASSMSAYLQQHGYRAFAVNGTWKDLEQQIAQGRPLIVALRPDGQKELHYVVIDGIDSSHGLVIMNDPAQRKLLQQERAEFERQWSATQHWLLLAVPASASQ